VSIIEPRKTLHAEYPLPPSQLVSMRVAADKAVNVYVLDQDTLDAFLSSLTEAMLPRERSPNRGSACCMSYT
jgi:hypothetical protein